MSSDLNELSLRVGQVVTENARVLQAVECLRAGDIAGLGELLDDSHRALAQDFEVSAPAVNLAVDVCREAGAYDARLTEAGFGGSVIGLFPSPPLRVVESLVTKAFSAREMPTPKGPRRDIRTAGGTCGTGVTG